MSRKGYWELLRPHVICADYNSGNYGREGVLLLNRLEVDYRGLAKEAFFEPRNHYLLYTLKIYELLPEAKFKEGNSIVEAKQGGVLLSNGLVRWNEFRKYRKEFEFLFAEARVAISSGNDDKARRFEVFNYMIAFEDRAELV